MTVNLKTLSIGPGIPCPSCIYGMGSLSELATPFYEVGFVSCKQCKVHVDLWDAASSVATASGSSFMTPMSLGAERTIFTFEIARGEHKELDLAAFGVPADATILDMGFTPQGGGCFPLVKHGNSVSARFIGPKVLVYGMALGTSESGSTICAGVTWIRQDEQFAESWLYLVDAFEALASRKYWHIILPAHIGFEISLMSLVQKALEARVSKERVRDFMNEGMGISAALNVVLPLLCDIVGARRIPDSIRGKLNRLRDLRNRLVHEGLPKEEITQAIAGEMLCAAMFGFEYVRYLVPRVLKPEV